MRKDYLAFFISLFVSRLAGQILLIIVPLIVFQTTNSVSWAGLFVLADLAMLFWQRNTNTCQPSNSIRTSGYSLCASPSGISANWQS